MRTISGGDDEAQNGQIQPIIEDKTTFDKRVNGYVTSGSSWNAAYFPFIYETGYVRATVRLGFFVQDIEIGGYEIRNYGSDVKVSDLPGAVTEYDTLSKDAAWRKDAWDRIEKIRKGDIKVIVKDASGNAVSNAKVDVNMYEHEFEFGTAVNSGIITSDAMAGALQQNFNTAVLENDTKCNYYLKNPQNARNLYEKCLNVGIKNLRGHVLFWDRNYMDRQEYEDNSAISEELWNLEKKGNKEEIQNYIKNHINTITADMAKYGVKEWDVLNEACNNKLLQDKFGKEIINEWFNMARESLGNDGMLYYNDFTTNEDLFTLLDTMVKNNVDFDGIGIQSHYRSVVNLEEVIDFYNRLDKYGKRLKITEYDYHALGDEILQGNYTRDILIASFAQESVDGFILWGFKGGPDSKYVLYDDDWNEKPGLKEWQDLVYNKWWTQESGTTSSDGSFSTRGFYGDYDITVTTADGKTKKVSVPCRKGSDNTITITLD